MPREDLGQMGPLPNSSKYTHYIGWLFMIMKQSVWFMFSENDLFPPDKASPIMADTVGLSPEASMDL